MNGKKSGTGINPETALRVDRLLGKDNSKIKNDNVDPKIRPNDNWTIEVPKKPEKKQFSQVRIEDTIITGFKNYIFDKRIDSGYSKLMNEVLRKFLEENNING